MAKTGKIRVLHVVTRMNVGGVAVLLDNLMRNLSQDEFEVVLLTGKCETPEGDYLDTTDNPYRVIKLEHFHKSLNLKDDFRSFIQICQIIKSLEPDIIHSHTSKAGLFARIAALLVRPSTKRIHTFHGHLLIGYFSKFKLMIIKSIEKYLAIISTGLIAMGTQVRDDLVESRIAPLSKFRVFFPGLTQPQFPSRSEARRSLRLDENKVYCTFIGRLTQIKHPERVLDVSEITKSQVSELEYLVVGDGELDEELKSAVQLRKLPVSFLGWRSDISTILAASDFLILTSDNEAVALSLIEASQAGIPIVTTPAGSVRDVAKDGINGFVTGFDVATIAEAVLKLANSEQLRVNMGAQGALIAREKFSISQMVLNHQDFYKELLRN